MPSPDPPHNARAFDAVARAYDAVFTETAVGSAQRQRVWQALAPWMADPATQRILELNCGTGADACWLAQQGKTVVATDISPEMLGLLREKAAAQGLQTRVQASVCAIEQLRSDPLVLQHAPYDMVFSNFGGLNCLSDNALRDFRGDLDALLRPGGMLILVVMSRFCPWETLYFLLKGDLRRATRRWGRQAVEGRLDAQNTVPTWYYGPADLRRLFDGYTPRALRPVGFWLPPSYLDPFFKRWPAALRSLDFLEKNAAPAALAAASDHYFLGLRKGA